jgi:uncharacterized DUF497 family protein
MRMEFEWDPKKDQANQEKHGISFNEAATAFDDELQLTISDPDHSVGEHRYLTIAMTIRGRLVVVSHTEDEDDHVRIISTRHPNGTERRIYEEGE